MVDPLRLYHNPRCTKSRQAKKILDDSGAPYEVVMYLDDPPSLTQLRRIAVQVEGGAASLLREREAREAGFEPKDEHTDDEILRFIEQHPRVLQRPILTRGDRAVVGRPPERVHDLL